MPNAAPDQGSRLYSAKAEIDDFMRRFLTFAKTDNAAARAVPQIVLRDGALTSADLTSALEKLDALCSRLDVETTNVIQIQIQNEALKSLHQDRMRRHARTVQDMADMRQALETRCGDLELRLCVATPAGFGSRLGAAKVTRMMKRKIRAPRVRRRGNSHSTSHSTDLVAAE